MTARESTFNKFLQLPSKIVGRLTQRGLGETVGWCWYQIAWRIREWRLGAATSEFAHGVVVGDDDEANGYEPIDYKVFDQLMEHLAPVGEHDGFIDYGCGMGRAVLLAAGYPYGHVIGLEIDPRLSNIAIKNVDIVSKRGWVKAAKVEILTNDASKFMLPESINHVFLFNSFTGNLLASTLEKIRESVAEYPRELRICYLQPISDSDPLQDLSWLRLEKELPTGYWLHVRSRVYSVIHG